MTAIAGSAIDGRRAIPGFSPDAPCDVLAQAEMFGLSYAALHGDDQFTFRRAAVQMLLFKEH